MNPAQQNPNDLIPLFREGSEDTPLSAERMNQLVMQLNAWRRVKIVRGGDSDCVYASSGNVVFQLADQPPASSDSGGNWNYRGQWSATADYEINDVVWREVTADNIRMAFCAKVPHGASLGTALQPAWPPDSSTWECFAGSLQGECKRFTISASDTADYFMGTAADGSIPTPVKIAKQPEYRPSLSVESIDGVNISYTWQDANKRTAYDGTNSQTEVCLPRFQTGKTIFAVRCADTGITGAAWVDLTPRVWLRKYVQ